MKRVSPDAGRRRARRRDDGASLDVVPLYAASVFAVATLAFATWGAPDVLRVATAAPLDTCPPFTAAARTDDDARG